MFTAKSMLEHPPHYTPCKGHKIIEHTQSDEIDGVLPM